MLRSHVAADVVAAAGRQIASECILGGSHPQSHGPALMLATRRQPMGQSKVIGMKMRAYNTEQWLAVKRAIKQLFPRMLRGITGDAAIDQRVTSAPVDLVVKHPQVDVIERERQRHAHPMHTGA